MLASKSCLAQDATPQTVVFGCAYCAASNPESRLGHIHPTDCRPWVDMSAISRTMGRTWSPEGRPRHPIASREIRAHLRSEPTEVLDISECRNETTRRYRFSFTRTGRFTHVDMHRVHHADYVGEVLIRIALGPIEDLPDFVGPTGPEIVCRIADALRILPQQVTLHRPATWTEARRPGLANSIATQVPIGATVPIGLPRYIEIPGEFMQTTALRVPSDATVDLVSIAAGVVDSFRPPRSPIPGLGPVPAVLALSSRKQVVFLDHPTLRLPVHIAAGPTAIGPNLYEPAFAIPAVAPPPGGRRMRPLGYYLSMRELQQLLNGIPWTAEHMQKFVDYLSQFSAIEQETGARFHIAHAGWADDVANLPYHYPRLRRGRPTIPTAQGPDFCLMPLQLLDWPWAVVFMFHKLGRLHAWLLAPSDHIHEMAPSLPMSTILQKLEIRITRLVPLGDMLAPADHTLFAMVTLTQLVANTALGSSPWSRAVFLQRTIYMASQLSYTPTRLLSTSGDVVMTHVFEPTTPTFALVTLTIAVMKPGLCSCWFPFTRAKAYLPDVYQEPLPLVDTHAVGPIPFAAMADYVGPDQTKHNPHSIERFRVMPPRGNYPDSYLETPAWPSLRTYRVGLRGLFDPQVIRTAMAALAQATVPPTVCMGLLIGYEERQWWDTWIWSPCFEIWLEILAATQSVYSTEIFGPAQKYRIQKPGRICYRLHVQHVALAQWRARRKRLDKAFHAWLIQDTGLVTLEQLAALPPSVPQALHQDELLRRILGFLPAVPAGRERLPPLELEARRSGLEFDGILERSEASTESEEEHWHGPNARIPEVD